MPKKQFEKKALRYKGHETYRERHVTAFRRLMCIWLVCVCAQEGFIKNGEMGSVGENGVNF